MSTSKAGIEVRGATELRASMKRAGEDLQDLKAAHAEAAGLVTSTARPRSPQLTGRLAGSVRGSGTATAAIIRAGGKSVPWAGPIHWGWPARNITAQPFIAEAAQQTEPGWVPIYTHAVEKILDRIEGV